MIKTAEHTEEELKVMPLFLLHEVYQEAGDKYDRIRKTANNLTGLRGPNITLETRKNSRATYTKLVERAYAAYTAIAEELDRRRGAHD